MWDKKFRIAVFSLLYEILFTGLDVSEFSAKSITDEYRVEVKALNNVFEDLDLDKVFAKILVFFENCDEYETKVKESTKNWDKTFLTVKACLFTFCIEIDEIDILSINDNQIVNSYLRLSQDYLGQENVPLVHAVVLKLLNPQKN